MIRRRGKRFYVEVFNPRHEWKLLGVLASIHIPDETSVFVTHFKNPDKHFFVKGLGYPINYDLLKMLGTAGVEFIIIPEQGKTGFRAYLAETKAYLGGLVVSEPLTEPQRCVPLRTCSVVDVDKGQLEYFIYGS